MKKVVLDGVAGLFALCWLIATLSPASVAGLLPEAWEPAHWPL